jgi:hypothetical protein
MDGQEPLAVLVLPITFLSFRLSHSLVGVDSAGKKKTALLAE